MNKNFDVITIGGATRDVFFKTDEGKIQKDKKSFSGKILAFEYGAKIVPEDAYFSYGGGGMNTAVCFAKMGLKVAAKVNIGSEGTGSLIHKILKERKVDTSLIARDKKDHTALSIIITDHGDHTMFLYRGANNNLKIKNWSVFTKTKWLYVSSLTGESEKILKDLGKFIKKSGVNFAWNPGSRQIEKIKNLKSILKVCDILLVNKAEAREIVGNSKKSDGQILKSLADMGPKIVVVTDGKKGSTAFSEGKIYKEKSHSSKVVETTGAGDAFGSTFVASQVLGYGIPESMVLASTNAGSVVSKVGAQEGLLSLKDLQR